VNFAWIHEELQRGLQISDQGEPNDVVKYWHHSYFFRWGHHVSAAIWAIEWHKDGESGRRGDFSPRLPHHRTCGSASGGSWQS
jgi:hypothetical protein